MLDHVLDELLLAHLNAVPALAALHGYTGQDSADHKLPALTVSTTSAPLAGSDTAFRGEVGVIIESEAHDTTAAAHGERVEAVRAAYPVVDVQDYDAGHAFNRDDDVSFNPPAAATAWRRTLDFFGRNLAHA